MSGKSKIEWTGSTWNPIRARLKDPLERPATKDAPLKILPAGTWGYHCERVSPGCQNCYACTMNGRTLPAWGTGLDYTRQSRDKVEIYLDEQELLKPLHWKRGRFVFPCSMTDLFAEFVPDEFIDRMFAVMALCPQHTFQVLTKRARRMRDWALSYQGTQYCPSSIEFRKAHGTDFRLPLPNVWLGVSAEDQPRADERILHLLATPAARRWVSYEPALGPVDLTVFLRPSWQTVTPEWSETRCIDWIVAGGESGPGARPMHPAWVRGARDQCAAAGVPFFFKQWGGFSPYTVSRHAMNVPTADGTHHRMYRVGKKRAGRLLDGREWNEMPAAAGARA